MDINIFHNLLPHINFSNAEMAWKFCLQGKSQLVDIFICRNNYYYYIIINDQLAHMEYRDKKSSRLSQARVVNI
jgi:hypothetical protein